MEPVYIADDGSLVYKGPAMKEGARHFIEWEGEHLCLVRNKDGVNVYRFEPDES